MSRVHKPAQGRVHRVAEAVEEAEDDIIEMEETEDSPDELQEGETEVEAAERIVAKYKSRAKTPSKAIRAFCIECVGGLVREVTRCTARTCTLFPFRHGHNPFHGRAGRPNPSAKRKKV